MAEIAISAAVGAVMAAGAYFLAPRPKIPGTEGPRLSDTKITTSTEGATIPRIFGGMRVPGQIIWASKFKETAVSSTSTAQSGGKGGGGGATSSQTNYTYSISFAVAFCIGNRKTQMLRVWADGKELDLSLYTYRFYRGGNSQPADPHIEAIEGVGNVPGFRTVAYVVFENMPLAEFGNRIPQITAELACPIVTDDPDDIQNILQGVTLIPATGESIYGTQQYNQSYVTGDSVETLQEVTRPDNVHNAQRIPDALVSLERLVRMQEDLDAIELVVTWFGTDLRAGNCRIIPKVESSDRTLTPNEWRVGSYVRANPGVGETVAEVVTYDGGGRPVFGGTPSDHTVTEMIQYIKNTLGKRVIFYPFLIMDIPGGNVLPNPYSNNAATLGQPAFPWRGRVTQSPAYGFTGTVDKTAAAATQVNNFFGGAQGYNGMVTHYANLCVAAGGVDGFIIGSELVGLTTSRSATGTYPAVSNLVSLAATVKGIVGSGCKVGYAADWSEFVHDVSSEGLWFHLDPLWASSNIDFVGVDNYLPLSDWRDGGSHLDYDPVNGPISEYDPNYLASQVEGGEYYDYYYADVAARQAQTRTPITDATYGKPWVYRRKDFRNWMANLHYNRPGHVESGSPTAWTPYMKPIWFTEFGCPAVNKGSNQPNVFYDPKSSESFFPYFSTGVRDDFIQRVFVETFLKYWRDNPITDGVNNYTPMHNMYAWTWDARPYPDYPARLDVWSDGMMWYFGHWLTGRLEAVPLPRLVASLCDLCGLESTQYDTSGLYGPDVLVRGFLIDNVTTVREMLNTLSASYQFDVFESNGKIKFILRGNTKSLSVSGDLLVVSDDGEPLTTLTRGQETELPTSAKITFVDEYNAFNTAAVDGKTAKGYSQNVVELKFPVVLTASYARSLADAVVQQAWIQRHKGSTTLPLSLLKLDPGDAINIPVGDRNIDVRITSINVTDRLEIEFQTFDLGSFSLPAAEEDLRLPSVAGLFGSVQVEFLDIPLFTGNEDFPWAPRLAAQSDPWPGDAAIYKQNTDTTYSLATRHPHRNAIGHLTDPLYNGPVHVWDTATTLYVEFDYGALTSTTRLSALENPMALAVRNADGGWEIIQFVTATLVAPNKYAVSDLLRGQLGTAHEMRSPVAAGATVVLLEPERLSALGVTAAQATAAVNYKWGPGRYPYTDATYQTGSRTGRKVGLRPYAPADVQLDRVGTNTIISWKRRTRFGGDDWEVVDVPLNESSEQYQLKIYNGSTVVRTEVLTSSSYTYTDADHLADIGFVSNWLKVAVSQYSDDYGNYGVETLVTTEIRSAS